MSDLSANSRNAPSVFSVKSSLVVSSAYLAILPFHASEERQQGKNALRGLGLHRRAQCRYEMQLTEAEAQALLTYVRSRDHAPLL
jgi:hypothetical protein